LTQSITSTDKITKKNIASDTAKVFDILGLFSLAIIPAKLLLQLLWKLPVKWDNMVPNDIQKKWIEWDVEGQPPLEYRRRRDYTPITSYIPP